MTFLTELSQLCCNIGCVSIYIWCNECSYDLTTFQPWMHPSIDTSFHRSLGGIPLSISFYNEHDVELFGWRKLEGHYRKKGPPKVSVVVDEDQWSTCGCEDIQRTQVDIQPHRSPELMILHQSTGPRVVCCWLLPVWTPDGATAGPQFLFSQWGLSLPSSLEGALLTDTQPGLTASATPAPWAATLPSNLGTTSRRTARPETSLLYHGMNYTFSQDLNLFQVCALVYLTPGYCMKFPHIS